MLNVFMYIENPEELIIGTSNKIPVDIIHYYAKNVIKGRWKEMEPIIMEDEGYAYQYAVDVIGGRWEEAESYLMRDPWVAYKYAKNILKSRWIEAEPHIKRDSESWDYYEDYFFN